MRFILVCCVLLFLVATSLAGEQVGVTECDYWSMPDEENDGAARVVVELTFHDPVDRWTAEWSCINYARWKLAQEHLVLSPRSVVIESYGGQRHWTMVWDVCCPDPGNDIFSQ